MSTGPAVWDLFVLTAGKDTEFALRGLLSRPRALGVRPIEPVKFVTHPRRDPAVYRDSHGFLRPFINQAKHALVVFDREGSGEKSRDRVQMEMSVQAQLDSNGWSGRSAVVVIDPELESWVWSDSPAVDSVLGWPCGGRALRPWLTEKGLLSGTKPSRPKEAVEAALRHSRTIRSSALYRSLAQQVSFERCTDPAFLRLRSVLSEWFRSSDSSNVTPASSPPE